MGKIKSSKGKTRMRGKERERARRVRKSKHLNGHRSGSKAHTTNHNYRILATTQVLLHRHRAVFMEMIMPPNRQPMLIRIEVAVQKEVMMGMMEHLSHHNQIKHRLRSHRKSPLPKKDRMFMYLCNSSELQTCLGAILNYPIFHPQL